MHSMGSELGGRGLEFGLRRGAVLELQLGRIRNSRCSMGA